MEKQIIRTLRLDNDIITLAEPVYIDTKANQVKILMRVVIELNNKIKELKEQLDAK